MDLSVLLESCNISFIDNCCILNDKEVNANK